MEKQTFNHVCGSLCEQKRTLILNVGVVISPSSSSTKPWDRYLLSLMNFCFSCLSFVKGCE